MNDFDATSLYLSGTYDEKSVHPKIETGFSFRAHMNDVCVETSNDQNFIQDGDESAITKIKFCCSPDLIFQHLPV